MPKDSNDTCYDTPGCFHKYKTAILYPRVLHRLQPGHPHYYRDTMRSLLVVLGLITALYASALPSPQINSDCEFAAAHNVSLV